MLRVILMPNTMKIQIKNILNLKLVTILEFQNIKKNWSKEVFFVIKIKNIVPWTYVINDLSGEESSGNLYENKLQKLVKKNLE